MPAEGNSWFRLMPVTEEKVKQHCVPASTIGPLDTNEIQTQAMFVKTRETTKKRFWLWGKFSTQQFHKPTVLPEPMCCNLYWIINWQPDTIGSPCGWADPLSDCQDGEEMGLTQRANRGGAGQGGQGQRHHPPVEHSFSGSVSIFVYDLLTKERFDFKSIFWPEKPGTIDDALFPSQTSKIQTLGINGDFVATPEAALAWPHRQQLLFQVRGFLSLLLWSFRFNQFLFHFEVSGLYMFYLYN